MKTNPDLLKALAEATERVKAMSPEDRAQMMRAQQESWVRAELSWPKPRFEWVNGVKVYASFEDYCND